jgi:hypothetical protein
VTARKKKAAKKTTSGEAAAPKQAKAASADPASSLAVNLGHVFALRPRVETSFKAGDLDAAKHFLREESYSTMEDAARAVAAKALELTRDGPGGRGRKGKRR